MQQRWILELKPFVVSRTPILYLQYSISSIIFLRTETQVYLHSFLLSQHLTSSAKSLLKELNKTTAGLGDEVEEESQKCSGSELLVLVRAKIEVGREAA